MTDLEDTISVDIKVAGVVVDTASRRPAPEYGSPAWDEFMREIEGKIKNATGQ